MDLVEILKYVLPSLVTGLIAFFVMSKLLKQENLRHMMEVKRETVKHSFPLRLQAHERLILLLERIDPVKMVNKIITPDMTASAIQGLLVKNIREEFDHNITQQLYVSNTCWKEVQEAKDAAIKLVTLAAGTVNPKSSAIEFSKNLIMLQAEKELYVSAKAITAVKNEISKLF